MACRMDKGRASKAREKVSDQICSAAATLLRLACGVFALGNLAPGLIEPGFHVVGEFERVFQIVVNPLAQRLDFGTGEPGNRGFNFSNSAHGGSITAFGKSER